MSRTTNSSSHRDVGHRSSSIIDHSRDRGDTFARRLMKDYGWKEGQGIQNEGEGRESYDGLDLKTFDDKSPVFYFSFLSGLGKTEQGIHTALQIQKTGTRAGMILDKSGAFAKSKLFSILGGYQPIRMMISNRKTSLRAPTS